MVDPSTIRVGCVATVLLFTGTKSLGLLSQNPPFFPWPVQAHHQEEEGKQGGMSDPVIVRRRIARVILTSPGAQIPFTDVTRAVASSTHDLVCQAVVLINDQLRHVTAHFGMG